MARRRRHWLSRLRDRFRGSGVGTTDPNIVGDAGPTDIPPGRDPDRLRRVGEGPVEVADEPLEPDEAP